MNAKAPKRTTSMASGKSARYSPTTAVETKKASEAYRAARARAGKPVPKIH
ncbi:MAG: hypothetical protein ACYDHH_26760 [Solirubrobacteraceae bacterium]